MSDPRPTDPADPAAVLAADAAAVSEVLAAAAAAHAAQASAAVLERVTGWEPQLKQRQLTARQWAQFAPLVRTAVLCADPSSAAVAGDLLTDALSLVIFATSRRVPLRCELVFRDSTAAAYLATVNASSRPTVASRLKALVAGITTAATATAATAVPQGAPGVDAVGAGPSSEAATGADAAAEPLLLNRTEPTTRELRAVGLTSAAATEALAALRLVRAQVLAVEPAALRREPRFRGRGRAVPYGGIEVVALLAAAATQRSAKRRLATAAAIGVGVGAGVTGEAAANLKGRDVVEGDPTFAGPVLRVGDRVVPLHLAFVAPVLAAAAHAGPGGWLLGGGPSRRSRISDLASGLANTDAHLVRLSSSRLAATWLTMHAVRGVPLGDLISAAGWTSATSLDLVLPYLPRTTPAGRASLAGAPTKLLEGEISSTGETGTTTSQAVPR